MNIDFQGRCALITGATGGIGSAIAKEFYNSGANIVITGRDMDKLNALRDKIVAQTPKDGIRHIKPTCVALDLTAIDAANTLIDNTIGSLGQLDILINNAAKVDGQMFLKTDQSFVQHIMHTNFTVPYNLMQLSLPHMLRGKYGRIINITSIAGQIGDAGMSAYAATKGALASATKSVATEYGRRGITANCIAPGIVDTDAAKKLPEERQKELKSQIPMRRFARPEEVAYMATFLASEYAAYVTGQQINVNGGLLR